MYVLTLKGTCTEMSTEETARFLLKHGQRIRYADYYRSGNNAAIRAFTTQLGEETNLLAISKVREGIAFLPLPGEFNISNRIYFF